tara:strand:+ start:886 stop:1110 length:225 start_codon:yes stop_codon:yes gene_type:complete
MNRVTHDMVAWGAGMAIGVTIGLSLNNIALGIGVGVVISAGLASTQIKKKILQAKKSSLTFVGFFVCWMIVRFG